LIEIQGSLNGRIVTARFTQEEILLAKGDRISLETIEKIKKVFNGLNEVMI